MQAAGNDEEKRSRTWRIVMTAATVLMIIVAVFFLYRGFLGNPLKGTWVHDESDMTLVIDSKDTAVLTWKEALDGKKLTVDLDYTLNKKAKQITFKAEREELVKVAEQLDVDVNAVESAISGMLTSFNYNLESSELTLTEWDYGDQLVFVKKK